MDRTNVIWSISFVVVLILAITFLILWVTNKPHTTITVAPSTSAGTTAVAPTYYSNIHQLAPVKSLITTQGPSSNTGSCLFVGDSTLNQIDYGYERGKLYSPAIELAHLWATAVGGSTGISTQTSVGYEQGAAYDGNITTTGWIRGQGTGVGGAVWQSFNSGYTWTYTVAKVVYAFSVYIPRSSSQLSIQMGSQAAVTVNPNALSGGSGVGVYVVTSSTPAKTITVKAIGPTSSVPGIVAGASITGQQQFINGCMDQSFSADWNNNATLNSIFNMNSVLLPYLVVLSLGATDYQSGLGGVASYQTNLQQIFATITSLNVPVLFITAYPDSSIAQNVLDAYNAAALTACSNANVAVFDYYKFSGSSAASSIGKGYTIPNNNSSYTDLHTPVGTIALANAIMGTIMASS